MSKLFGHILLTVRHIPPGFYAPSTPFNRMTSQLVLKIMNIFYPKFKWNLLPRMLGIAFLGAIIAGLYGILHDQITYSISPEYFTKLKFNQFHYANFGFPARIFVSEVGFLATWWVGLFSGWFLARIAVPRWSATVAFRRCLAGFSIIFILAFVAAATGYLLGICHSGDYSYWDDTCLDLGVTDIPAFVRVAYIHNSSYIGGLIGLIVAIIFLLCHKSAGQDAQPSLSQTGPT